MELKKINTEITIQYYRYVKETELQLAQKWMYSKLLHVVIDAPDCRFCK